MVENLNRIFTRRMRDQKASDFPAKGDVGIVNSGSPFYRFVMVSDPQVLQTAERKLKNKVEFKPVVLDHFLLRGPAVPLRVKKIP